MSDPATARHIALVETLIDCAGNLAVAAHDMAMALRGKPEWFLRLAAESRQSGFAARMGVKLSQALRAGTLPARPLAPLRAEAHESERADAAPAAERASDRERCEHESESEPAPSLPLFLKTLRGVAEGAERRTADAGAQAREQLQAKLTALLADASRNADLLDRLRATSSGPSTRAQLLGSTRALRRESG
jgi:hypothetical protein